MENEISFYVFLALLVIGYCVGTAAERRHYNSIHKREKELLHLPAVTLKNAHDPALVTKAVLVHESVVVSVDYFKRILASLRTIVGGAVGPYETLVDRARREAVLRLKESAGDANLILNLRIETSSIGQSADSRRSLGSVEALAYGTAVWLKQDSTP